MMEKSNPKYGIFIIESMDFENESKGNLDGYTLKTILDLCGIPNQYYYVRTKIEFKNMIDIFDESEYGFLHIACHGTKKSLILTYEEIEFKELESIIGEALYHRRLFLSACNSARFELAELFIPKYHCYSLIGSPDEIDYDKAAIFWSSFYYLIYQQNDINMPQRDIMPILLNVTKLFKLKLNYYSIIRNGNPISYDHLKEINYDSGKKTLEQLRKTKFNNIYRD